MRCYLLREEEQPRVFDDTSRFGDLIDHTIADIASALREYILQSDEPLSEQKWKVAGYRFARALAQERIKGYEMTSAFMEGMRIFSDQHATLRPPKEFNEHRAISVIDKAKKLLALAAHKRTGESEARAAFNGFIKLYIEGEFALIAHDRQEWLLGEIARLKDVVKFVKTHHPEVFPWKPDEQTPVDF